MVNFPTRIPDCDSQRPTLLDLFISSDASICSTMAFPPLVNSDLVIVSVYIDFSSNSKRDSPFHQIAYNYSHVDFDGLHEHLSDVLWEDILELSVLLLLLLLLLNFVCGFRFELMSIFLIVSIRSSLIHLHGFEQPVLRP